MGRGDINVVSFARDQRWKSDGWGGNCLFFREKKGVTLRSPASDLNVVKQLLPAGLFFHLGNPKKADEVLASDGLQGKITGLTERVATLEIVENVRVKIARSYILGSVAGLEGGDKKDSAPCAIGGNGC